MKRKEFPHLLTKAPRQSHRDAARFAWNDSNGSGARPGRAANGHAAGDHPTVPAAAGTLRVELSQQRPERSIGSTSAYPVSSARISWCRDRDFPRTIVEFQRRFPDDSACRSYLFACRWPEGFKCPTCGFEDAYVLPKRML